MGEPLRDQLRVPLDKGGVTLAGYPTDATPGVASRARAEQELVELKERLADLHDLLMANGDRAVLVLLQGLDASGKSGTIKHVVSAFNPVGVRVASFTEPDGKEQREPFLARIERELPEPGQVGVFDRSHYEDAIVPTVTERLAASAIDERVRTICAFEKGLVKRGTLVVKFLLHISYDEQRERFLRRLRRPDKQWKFSANDLETRLQWPDFQAAYGDVIGRTSIDQAPWYVVPADHKWYRNWAVASVLVDVLEGLGQEYPQPDLDVDELTDRLAPPN